MGRDDEFMFCNVKLDLNMENNCVWSATANEAPSLKPGTVPGCFQETCTVSGAKMASWEALTSSGRSSCGLKVRRTQNDRNIKDRMLRIHLCGLSCWLTACRRVETLRNTVLGRETYPLESILWWRFEVLIAIQVL